MVNLSFLNPELNELKKDTNNDISEILGNDETVDKSISDLNELV